MKIRHEKIGLIAGNGELPEKIVQHYLDNKWQIFVVYLKGKEDAPSYLKKIPHITINIGSVGKAIKFLRTNQVKELVLAGGLQRPQFSKLRPDSGGIKLLARISKAAIGGDNSLLSVVLKFLEDSGFNIIGADEVLDDLVVLCGALGNIKPDKQAIKDIKKGQIIAETIGALDIGQGVVVSNDVVIAVEAIEGTDAMLERCKSMKHASGGVLIKVKKPKQDRRVDLPAIGIKTIENAHKAGLRGIAVSAGEALIVDKASVIKKADKLGLFVFGV